MTSCITAKVLSVRREKGGRYTVLLSGIRKLRHMTERELDAKLPGWRRYVRR